MQVQTIFKTGNSDVVTIPSEIKKTTGMLTGVDVVMNVASDGKTVLLNKVSDVSGTKITPEFYNWLEGFNKEYGSTLKALANK